MVTSSIKHLLSNMCCSECKSDFDENSVIILREEKNIKVLNIKCSSCGKDFGISIMGMSEKTDNDKESSFDFIPCPSPVGYDDILTAHEFINNLEKDWLKYIPDDFKTKQK